MNDRPDLFEQMLDVTSDDALLLKNQLCFPLYAAARKIVRVYTPILDKLGLTYTQYITLLVLWEEDGLSVKELGNRLFLDSGTLTPLLKKLETQGLCNRIRDQIDERNVSIYLTAKGRELKGQAREVPSQVASCITLKPKDILELQGLLNRMLAAD